MDVNSCTPTQRSKAADQTNHNNIDTLTTPASVQGTNHASGKKLMTDNNNSNISNNNCNSNSKSNSPSKNTSTAPRIVISLA